MKNFTTTAVMTFRLLRTKASSSPMNSSVAHPLNRARLSSPSIHPSVRKPQYDLNKVKEGIVHIGVGNFARAFLFMRLNDMMNKQQGFEWGVVGVNLLPLAGKKCHDVFGEKLTKQDCLYTVLERSEQGDTVHIVGVIKSYFHAPSDPQKVLDKLVAANIRIVSLTVTEGGYYYDEETGALNQEHPDIRVALTNQGDPVIWLEYLLAAARKRRYDPAAGGFTVWSCDNVQHNGDVAKRVLLEFSRLRDEHDLANWIESNVYFPNSMVDRITPATQEKHRKEIAKYGLLDDVPVPTESFSRFCVTDNFADAPDNRANCPPLKEMDVQVVKDVTSWENMKLCMLNGSHSWLSYLGVLAKLEYVHDAALHPDFKAVLLATLRTEVQPNLPRIPNLDLDEEAKRILLRFSNTKNPDTLLRICSDAPGKIPKFLLSSVQAQLDKSNDNEITLLALGIAGWFMYLRDCPVSAYDTGKPAVEKLHKLAKDTWLDATGDHERLVRSLLDSHDIFSNDLRNSKVLISALTNGLRDLDKLGVVKTLKSYAATPRVRAISTGSGLSKL